LAAIKNSKGNDMNYYDETCEGFPTPRLEVEAAARLETIRNGMNLVYEVSPDFLKELTVRLCRLSVELDKRDPATIERKAAAFRAYVQEPTTEEATLGAVVDFLVGEVSESIAGEITDRLLGWKVRCLVIAARELQRRGLRYSVCYKQPEGAAFRVGSNQGPQVVCARCLELLKKAEQPTRLGALVARRDELKISSRTPWMSIT